MKTTKTYEIDVKQKYLDDKNSNLLRGNLYNLTRKNIKSVCINLIDEGVSIEDKVIMRNYFKLNETEDLRRKVENFDIEGFRPICNFLKGNTSSIQSLDALELIAAIIDFIPRPYKLYRKEGLEKYKRSPEKSNIGDGVIYVENLNKGKSKIIVKPKNRKLFAWFSNASAFNKLLIFGGGLLFCLSVFLTTNYILNDTVKWMVWEDDHYVKVKFDDKTYKVNQLKYYKEDRIKYFKKIKPNCDYNFFSPDGSVRVWYGKNIKKELEIFTDLALHPETGETLKPITKYMIEKYICH